MNTAARLRATLVAHLVEAGYLRSQPWIDAFSTVPRHLLLPRFFRQSADLAGWQAVSAEDPGALELVYSNATWVTQLDSDPQLWQRSRAANSSVPGVPTSSSSAPGLVALMLEALAVETGHRVLEIGSGSGYNAALLSQRLGSAAVVTIEWDPVVAEAATAGIRACGYRPRVAVGDGGLGLSAGAPYDRLIATCALPRVPSAWISQLSADGLILFSVHRDLGGRPLVLLRLDSNGGAEGNFLPDYGGFMPTRLAPPADASARLRLALDVDPAQEQRRPAVVALADLDGADFEMAAALRLPGVAAIEFTPVTGAQRWLLADDGSWAFLDPSTNTVAQYGGRRLWDELEAAYHEWRGLGSPRREQFGLTVAATGAHRYWVDRPDRLWWTDPA